MEYSQAPEGPEYSDRHLPQFVIGYISARMIAKIGND